MGISASNWANKNGTADKSCNCKSWKNHWIKYSNKDWPETCSVLGCTNIPTLGAHVYHQEISGDQIVPMCDGCNKVFNTKFSLKGGVTVIKAIRDDC